MYNVVALMIYNGRGSKINLYGKKISKSYFKIVIWLIYNPPLSINI